MATFVLVPGAAHPAWCWHRVVPLLEAAGHKAVPVDLPGTGENLSIDLEDATLAIWAGHVADVVRAAEKPVLLVGHSRGGHVISEAGELAAEHLAGLVYLSAVMPVGGKSIMESSGTDPGMRPDIDARGFMTFPAEMADYRFYNRCSPEDAVAMRSRLFAEPLGPSMTPSGVTPERWGRVPRAYIECTDDNAVTLENQRRMQAISPCYPVVTLDSDHSPFLCAPDALAGALIEVADRLAS